MSDDRELRRSATADVGYLMTSVATRGGNVYAEMERRARHCDDRGHRWADPVTRQLCTYCGSYWRS
jgi:hypothetical protein